MELVDKEVKQVWGKAKKKSQEKVEWTSNRFKNEISHKEGTFKGVLIGNSELDNLEKEIEDSEKVKKDSEIKVPIIVINDTEYIHVSERNLKYISKKV